MAFESYSVKQERSLTRWLDPLSDFGLSSIVGRPLQSGDRGRQIIPLSPKVSSQSRVIPACKVKDARSLFFNVDINVEQLNEALQVRDELVGSFLNQQLASG
jgi:hypothetical protein